MKKKLWLFLAHLEEPGLSAVLPTLAWLADAQGAEFECYLSSKRDGRLFARTGSTVIGGRHFEQFNYLHSVFDVSYIVLKTAGPFESSLAQFGGETIVRAETVGELYRVVFGDAIDVRANGIVVVGSSQEADAGTDAETGWDELYTTEASVYRYPDIYFGRKIGFAIPCADEINAVADQLGLSSIQLFDEAAQETRFDGQFDSVERSEANADADPLAAVSLDSAYRWAESAQGVAFGDPAAILSQIPRLCREKRVSVYGRRMKLQPHEVVASAYTEETTSVVEDVYALCETTGNRLMVGRQTGDGDLFAWSKRGISLQIMDPNRPAFPVIESVPHTWESRELSCYDLEPDDVQLHRWADEGRVLASLVWHSGEMAHNEAMLNLVELVAWTGLKMGIGVHVARYSAAPQAWELIATPVSEGGALGLIEPVLHTGGWGVMTENTFPTDLLRKNVASSLEAIRKIGGAAATPRGYYAFMDSDMPTFTAFDPEIVKAVESGGLEYFITNAYPGRNRVLYQTDPMVAINQTSRSIATGSPYVRVTSIEDLTSYTPDVRPGWFLGVLDAPVIAFAPYIWREGSRFMRIVDYLTGSGNFVNVTPHVVARYARILRENGQLADHGNAH